MKKACALFLALFLCLSAFAAAEDGMRMEVIKADGISIIRLIPAENMRRAFEVASAAAALQPGLVIPEFVETIDEEAFMGISASRIEISENVVFIEARAFADCKNLREITIPASVVDIEPHAFDGCTDVTVYGKKGSAAEEMAIEYGFTFVEPEPEPQALPVPPILPDVPFGTEEAAG